MSRPPGADVIIELIAADPDGALACDTTIADEQARAGLAEALREHMRPPVRPLPDGVEVAFAPEGREAVERYMRLESQCCSFLTLRLELRDGDVVLRVAGRPEAMPWINRIFA